MTRGAKVQHSYGGLWFGRGRNELGGASRLTDGMIGLTQLGGTTVFSGSPATTVA